MKWPEWVPFFGWRQFDDELAAEWVYPDEISA